MSKKIILILIAALIITIIVSVQLTENQNSVKKASKYNAEYVQYLDKEIYGTEVISLINKAINSNESNNIEKDEDGNYIENDNDSIKISVYISDNGKTYDMEAIEKTGIERFVKNFNLLNFKCTNIEYHQNTGKVSKIYIEQQKEDV